MDETVLVIGDLHLGVGKSNPIFFNTALKYAEWIKGICLDKGIKTIIQLGDIFHHQYVLCSATLNTAYAFFDILKEFELHIIVGNHDVPKKNYTSENSLKLLSEWPNITIHEKITTIDNITFCGWGSKIDDIPDNQKIVFGHFDIRGFEMSAGKIAEHGFTASDLMEKCHLLMSGHYHKPQTRIYNKKPLIYAGSCYQLNWGESGEDKFAYILNTKSLKIDKMLNNISPRFEYIRSEKDHYKISGNFVTLEANMENIRDKELLARTNNALDFRTMIKEMPKSKLVLFENELHEIKDFKGIQLDEVIDEYVSAIPDLTDEEKKMVANISKRLYNECI